MESTGAVGEAAGTARPPDETVAEESPSSAPSADVRPVAGSAQPPHGLSGSLRRAAYTIPEHRARHWALLLLADRVNVIEGRVGDALARPLHRLRLHALADRVRRDPLPIAAVATGVALFAGRRILNGRRRR